jgi:hypothetical protein
MSGIPANSELLDHPRADGTLKHRLIASLSGIGSVAQPTRIATVCCDA